MRISRYVFAFSTLLVVAGCGKNSQEGVPGPRTGTLQMDNLTPDQQIEKVKNDPKIPEEYKQTYINSMRAKQGQPPIKEAPQGAPGTGQ